MKHFLVRVTKLENLDLFVPWMFVFIALTSVANGIVWTSELLRPLHFVQSILFFHATHVAITVGLFLGSKKIRAIFLESAQSTKKIALCFLSLYLFSFFVYFYYGTTKTPTSLGNFLLFALLIYGIHHARQQSKGLQLLKLHQVSSELTQTVRSDLERFIWCSLLIDSSIFFKFVLLSPILQKITLALGLSLSSFFIFRVYRVLLFSRDFKEQSQFHLLFAGRWILTFFIPLSPLSVIGLQCNHGIEYLCVASKLLKIESSTKWWVIACSSLYLALFFISSKALTFISLTYLSSEPALILGSLLSALAITHYWMDGYIFSFKNPLARKYILPRLK